MRSKNGPPFEVRGARFAGRAKRSGRLTLSAMFAIAWAATAFAQAPPAVRRVEFDEAVRIAIERNPSVATAATAVSEADARLQVVRATTRPLVSASVSNTTLDGSRGFSGGVTQPQNQFAFGATASMPLLAAVPWAQVSQARDEITVATETAADVRRQVAVAAAQAYLAVVAARRQLDVDERALENARAHLDYAEKRLAGGVGSRLNQLRAAQAVSGDESRLENTRLALRRAQEALGVALAEDGPIDAAGVPAFEPPPSGAAEEWMTRRPDLRAQTAAIQSAEHVIRDAWKVWVPTASVAFTPQLVAPAGLFQPARTWRLAFSISQPVFDSSPRAQLALRRIALDRAQLARTTREIEVRAEIRVAEEAVASQERALESARRAADQANEVLRISTAAFEVGATTNIEVIDAQRSARDAETTAAIAEDALRRARLDLLVAVGRFPQ
ncbi:MAG: TolC family protein [Acidobacteria bacterium]|nr:TolC family protein [Acidobacteriota bacterium]